MVRQWLPISDLGCANVWSMTGRCVAGFVGQPQVAGGWGKTISAEDRAPMAL